MTPLRILHTIAGVWTTTGGPAASVPGLCAELARRGHQVTLLTGSGTLAPAVRQLEPAVRVVTTSLGPYVLANYSRQFRRVCRELAAECDVLHTHGLWLHPNFVTSEAGADLRKPVVISPRGMLAPWALSQRRVVKRLMWSAAQQQHMQHAALIHATSLEEEHEIRRANVTTSVVVVPNGIDPSEYSLSKIESFRRDGRERVVLFLSRVHPKKGVDLLLDAWAAITRKHTDARLVIAGPGEPQHIAQLRSRLAESVRVDYIGSLEGEEKIRRMALATVVVLPSRNENYGMVVAESLACGTPVITTTGVPWPEISEERCGWRVPIEVETIAAALDEALTAPPDQLAGMGSRGRQLIERAHTTAAAAVAMESAYASVLTRSQGVA